MNRMKRLSRFLFLGVVGLFVWSEASASKGSTSIASVSEEYVLESPDGLYRFVCYQKPLPSVVGSEAAGQATVGHGVYERQLYYRVTYRGEEVIRESELGVLIENALFESALGIENDSLELWGGQFECDRCGAQGGGYDVDAGVRGAQSGAGSLSGDDGVVFEGRVAGRGSC